MTQSTEKLKCADCQTSSGCECSEYKTSINALQTSVNDFARYCNENPNAEECRMYEV